MLLRIVVFAVAMLSLPLTLVAQGGNIQGVWRVVEIEVVGGDNPRTIASPQPALYIFTKGHYSIMSVNTDKPRTVIPGAGGPAAAPSDKEKLALYDHWAPFTANSGTYTIKGTTLMTKPMVAKNQGVMEGQGLSREFKLEGQTLWLIQKPAAGQPGAETRIKLTRLE